jgi:hypothetical protein
MEIFNEYWKKEYTIDKKYKVVFRENELLSELGI